MLIANSRVEIAGEVFFPGNPLPDMDSGKAADMIAVGYAVEVAGDGGRPKVAPTAGVADPEGEKDPDPEGEAVETKPIGRSRQKKVAE